MLEIAAAIHEEDSEISFRVDWLTENGTEHVVVSARLEHEHCSEVVIMLLKIMLLFDHCVSRKFRAVESDSAVLALSMSLNRSYDVLIIVVIVDLGLKILSHR